MAANLFVKAGLMALQISIGMMRKIEGPRVDSRKFSSGQYNVSLPRIWATSWVSGNYDWGKDLIEVKRRRKTKGGKHNEYSYFADFSVVLTCHALAAVRRVKADGHLVFDLSGEGPVTPFSFYSADTGGKPLGGALLGLAGIAYASGDQGQWLTSDWFSVYLGTDTQLPDPVIAADIDNRFGEGSTPAYRGYGRIMFHNLPLEKFGNRVPQIEAEVQSVIEPVGPTKSLTTLYQAANFQFSHDFSIIATGETAGFTLIDTAARQAFGAAAFDPVLTYGAFALREDGTLLGLSDSLGNNLYRYELSGTGTFYHDIASSTAVWTVTDTGGVEHWLTKNLFDGADFFFDGNPIDTGAMGGTSFNASGLFADAEGGVWVVGGENPGADTAHFLRLSGPVGGVGYLAVNGLPTGDASAGAVHFRNDVVDQFVFEWNGDLYAADRTTGAVLASNTAIGEVPHFGSLRPGRATAWCGLEEVSLSDLTVVRTEVPGTWGLSSVGATIYDPINHALITRPSGFVVRWLSLDRLGASGVTLPALISDVYEVGGGDPAKLVFDASLYSVTIDGYQVSSGDGREWVEPLLDVYDVAARPHGFQLEFLPRGAASGGTISSDDFAIDKDGSGALFSSVAEGGTDVPSQVVLRFADLDADLQPNGAVSPRLAELDGERVLTIDMSTLALTGDAALQLVARYHRRRIFDAKPIGLSQTTAQIALEPEEVRTLDLRGFITPARLHSMEMGADRSIRTEWRRDDPSVHLLDATQVGALFDGRPPSVITVPMLSQGFFLDMPYLTDADAASTPSLYILAAPLIDGPWPGAAAMQEVGGEYTEELATVESSSAATWGYMSDVLPTPEGGPWLWDRLSVVQVVLQTGSLTGCTEADLDADETRNQCRIGDEIVQFTTPTLTAPRTYDVSGFKRGRRGSEWACPDHGAGEKFVLLDTAQDVAMGLSEVGTDLSFKAITGGRTTGFPIALAPFTGASLKPYAPVHLVAVKDAATGDWTFTWVRRTRVGGAWTGGTPIPLSEASEEYELDLGDGVTTVTKTVAGTGVGFGSYVWTAAQQVTDTGSDVSTGELVWAVVQISDAVGRGFVAQAA